MSEKPLERSLALGRKARRRNRELHAKDKAVAKAASQSAAKTAASEAKRKEREERLKRLNEFASPEKQKLLPTDRDRLNFFSSWHFTLVLTGIVVLVLILFVMISISQSRYQLGREVSRLTKEQQRLQEINGLLQARIEELVVLEDLELIARENLHLITPQKGQIYEIE
jgi:cell division protein FtsL